MASEKQIEANRLNSTRSTGPQSPAGKLISSRNATKHGILAQQMVLRSENSAEFATQLEHFIACLSPVGPIEVLLVQRIAIEAWRLDRISCIEAGIVDSAQDSQLLNMERTERGRLGGIFENCSNTFLNLKRYETATERSLYKALHELQRLQATRKGDSINPPIAIEIYGLENN